MSDEHATFEQTRTRLEEILVQVRKKDTSLEQSLDLLEEGVRLANACNELIDQTSWRSADGDAGDAGDADAPVEDGASGTEEPATDVASAGDPGAGGAAESADASADTAPAPETLEPLEDDERS